MILATLVAIAATLVQVAWVWARHREVDYSVSCVLIVVFGGPSLLQHEEVFIK